MALPILQLPAGEFASKAATPEGGAEVEKLVNVCERAREPREGLGLTTENAIDKYRSLQAKDPSRSTTRVWLKYGPTPYTFSSEGMLRDELGADMKSSRMRRAKQLPTKSLVYGGNISSLTMSVDVVRSRALARVYQIIQDNPQVQAIGEDGALQRQSLRRALLLLNTTRRWSLST